MGNKTKLTIFLLGILLMTAGANSMAAGFTFIGRSWEAVLVLFFGGSMYMGWGVTMLYNLFKILTKN